MIISASRRTDIPAFYSEWMIDRLREGGCLVPNPFNPKQTAHVSLNAEDVDAIVFWTKDASPMLKHLDTLDEMGYRYLFQYTLNDCPPPVEPHLPDLQTRLETFRRLSERIGQKRVLWRYDPILLSDLTGLDYHTDKIGALAYALRGYTKQLTISFYDDYRKSKRRLLNIGVRHCAPDVDQPEFSVAMEQICAEARNNGMRIFSCAEKLDLARFGIPPGRCIDAQQIGEMFGINIEAAKDKNQRKECGCSVSKDIGTYNSCLHGCAYCYATNSPETAMQNYKRITERVVSEMTELLK